MDASGSGRVEVDRSGSELEAIIRDVNEAYLDLPELQKSRTKPRLFMPNLFTWQSVDALKKRFAHGLSHLNYPKTFESLSSYSSEVMKTLWTGDNIDNVEIALYISGIHDSGPSDISQSILVLLLWELYFDKPEKHLEMLMTVTGKSSIPHWVHKLSPTQTEIKTSNEMIEFCSRFRSPSVYRFLANRPGGTYVAKQVCQDIDKKKENDPIFRFYLHFLELHGPNSYYEYNLRGLSPIVVGVKQAIHDAVDSYLKWVEEKMKKFLCEPISKGGASEVQLDRISARNPNHVHLLYGVSGSGKTRTIEHLLHKNWGYYFLPGNLDQTKQGNLYDPRREGYSRDSCFLWNLIQNINNAIPGVDTDDISIHEWSPLLILSRHLIFNKFLEVAKSDIDRTPAKWLAFQKSCSPEFDPFEALFRLLLLVPSDSPNLEFKMPCLTDVLSEDDKAFYYCLDEAQCYLDTPVPITTHTVGGYKNLLEMICGDILLRSKSSGQHKHMRFIVSGTSLKLQQTVSTIQSTKQIQQPDFKVIFTECTPFTDFPLLTNGEQLQNLLEERGLLEKIEEFLDCVKECGVPLQGRYLWSARYVDRLSNHSGGFNSNVISKAANETIKEAKNALKERLSRLWKENYHVILQELCWVVIQSDLLDGPMIFETDKDHQMISEAFAVVGTEKGSLVGTLKERLAMEAATEWFQDQDQQRHMYIDTIWKYLRFAKNDASSFGKATEWFLALELWNLLHHSDRMTGSEGENRRKKILETLSKASVDGKDPIESFSGRLQLASTHHLVEGKNIGHTYDGGKSESFSSSGENPNHNHAVPMWEWMKSVREGQKPVASFYFPDILAGPDILFSLEPKEPSSSGRILCVLQLKTGNIESMKPVISTTNLQMSYLGNNQNRFRDEHRKNLEGELKEWKKRTIIRVLVYTKKDFTRPENIAQYLAEEKKTSNNELFFLCDRKYTEDLFGETFTGLVDAKTTSRESVEAREKSQELVEQGSKLLSAMIDTRSQRKRKRGEEKTETDSKRPKR